MSCHFLPLRPELRSGTRALTVSCGVNREATGYYLLVRLQLSRPGENPVVESLGDGERLTSLDDLLNRAARWALVPRHLRRHLQEELDAAQRRRRAEGSPSPKAPTGLHYGPWMLIAPNAGRSATRPVSGV